MPTALAPAKPGDYFDARFDSEEDAIDNAHRERRFYGASADKEISMEQRLMGYCSQS